MSVCFIWHKEIAKNVERQQIRRKEKYKGRVKEECKTFY